MINNVEKSAFELYDVSNIKASNGKPEIFACFFFRFNRILTAAKKLYIIGE